MKKDNRITSVEYMSAIGIIMVVLGHYPATTFDAISPYYYHMPLFFFIGGMFASSSKSVFESIKKTVIDYYIYIAMIFIIVALMTNIIAAHYGAPLTNVLSSNIADIIKTTVKSNFHNNTNFLVAWFLFSYSIVFISSALILKSTSNLPDILQKCFILCIAILSGYIGMDIMAGKYHLSGIYYYNTITQVLVGLMYYLLGKTLRNLVLKSRSIILFTAGISILFLTSKLGMTHPLEMAWSKYPDGFFYHLITSMSGIYCIAFISNTLADSKNIKTLSRIGNSSKYIMSWHMLIFFFIEQFLYHNGFFVALDAKGIDKPLAFMPINIIAAILIPVTIKIVTDMVLRSIKNKNIFW
ncbi:acyltransferase family protein [Yokenella regensburgei]|uniref:acyltransferase family protein n=1 Tax=Yokenella regensburgei TaxID=158877 RepID=UPI003ED91D6C